jgi:hypothetical protein
MFPTDEVTLFVKEEKKNSQYTGKKSPGKFSPFQLYQ